MEEVRRRRKCMSSNVIEGWLRQVIPLLILVECERLEKGCLADIDYTK